MKSEQPVLSGGASETVAESADELTGFRRLGSSDVYANYPLFPWKHGLCFFQTINQYKQHPEGQDEQACGIHVGRRAAGRFVTTRSTGWRELTWISKTGWPPPLLSMRWLGDYCDFVFSAFVVDVHGITCPFEIRKRWQ